jgi:hypothetical protein
MTTHVLETLNTGPRGGLKSCSISLANPRTSIE